MRDTIINKLKHIEQANSIQLLFACESGSRAWGFPSPDSDYDVRFIYIRTAADYLSIENSKDDLSFPINDELDVYGWDLRKVLQLIKKSNTTPFEWLQSPVIYLEQPGFRETLWNLCPQYFGRRSNMHHYLGIASSALATMENEDEIKIKKLFYVLRPLLAAKWNLESNSIAPMTIAPLMELLPAELRAQVQELINWKTEAVEGQLIKIPVVLHSWIKNEFARIETLSGNFEKNYFEAALLNAFFIQTLQLYDHSRNEGKGLAAV